MYFIGLLLGCKQKLVLLTDQYTKTSILDPSNLSETPILESFIKRPTIYYIETHSESLFCGLKGPFVQGAL